jgi:DNA-binding Xre family transcriptional regulator
MKNMAKKSNPRSGSSLDDFLKEDGIRDEVQTAAIKKVLAVKLEAAMKENNLSKKAMADRMQTSRSQLDRLLDPENEAVTLQTMSRAAAALGLSLEIHLA